MNTPAANRQQTPRSQGFARAAAMATVISLQLVWVGALVCAVNCAKDGCAATVAGATRPPAGHCHHSGTIPEGPAQDSGGSTHGRHCPAANLHNWTAVARATATPQMRLEAASSIVVALPRAAALVDSPDASGACGWQEISPHSIATGFPSIPLRI